MINWNEKLDSFNVTCDWGVGRDEGDIDLKVGIWQERHGPLDESSLTAFHANTGEEFELDEIETEQVMIHLAEKCSRDHMEDFYAKCDYLYDQWKDRQMEEGLE